MPLISRPEDAPQGAALFIYGAGNGGRAVRAALEQVPGAQVAGFIDSARSGELDGLPIRQIDDFLRDRPANAEIVIASQYAYDISRALRDRGVFRYWDASPLTASLLAPPPPAPPSLQEQVEGLRAEVDALYAVLHRLIHEPENAPELTALHARAAFDNQWRRVGDGEAMLSEPWFRDNVARIVAEEELSVAPGWLQGKRVLDCGCGNGRWAYGLARLGADVVALDASDAALAATRDALAGGTGRHRFVRADLEDVDQALAPDETFDLAWSWGVLMFCRNFRRALTGIARRVAPGGALYLYLYGRESLPFAEDVALFKRRVAYNAQPDWPARKAFLLREVGGDPEKIHQRHDLLSPLLNRRFDFAEVAALLGELGFADVRRVKAHSELFIRASRLPAGHPDAPPWQPPPEPPYWFQRYR